MLIDAFNRVKDLGRLQELSSILIRFGFGDMVKRLGLGQALEQTGRLLKWQEAEELSRLEHPQRIRRALEEMGPTFVKLGQVMASRIDLFPPDYITEFEKLHDQVPTLPFNQIREQLEADLGAPVDEIFSQLDEKALAAASIAQVHRAKLRGGDEVILKIRRPGITQLIEADLRLMQRLAELADREIEDLRQFAVRQVVNQFAQALRQELDLAHEARSAERLAENFRDNPDIQIPKVYWQWTGERLNIQEYVDGIRGTDLKAVDAAGLDRKILARNGAGAVCKMVFEDGFFHTDPHPGNIFYLLGNRIVLVDFGMTGRLSSQRQEELVDLLYSVISRDCDQIMDILLLWAQVRIADRSELAVEVEDLIDRVHGVPLKNLNISQLVMNLVAMMRRYQLHLPPDLSLLTKAFMSLEGTGRQLDPEFDMISVAEPFLQKSMMARYSPQAIARKGQQGAIDLLEFTTGFPKDLRKLVTLANNGQLRARIDMDHLELFTDRISRAASRLTMGLVIAALIIGSSIVMTVAGGEVPFGLAFFAMLGFCAAVIGGFWLLYSIWSNR